VVTVLPLHQEERKQFSNILLVLSHHLPTLLRGGNKGGQPESQVLMRFGLRSLETLEEYGNRLIALSASGVHIFVGEEGGKNLD